MPQDAVLFSADGEKLRRAGCAIAAFERPFDMDEVLTVITGVLGRAAAAENIRYDAKSRKLYGGGESVRLSEKEAALFSRLLTGEVLSRADAAAIFADGKAESNVVDVYIHYLRRKLRRVSPCELLTAARGTGYKLSAAHFTLL
ncbi:MAG: winged helix-turn-helix transcriptional regulator [Clostridia bacterium]|nr:winged helix-turn-helix transcriptional regulator [Clostridia bacterium]